MQHLGNSKKADEKSSIKARQRKRTRTPIIIEQRRGTIVVAVAFLWRRVRIVVVVVKGVRRYDGAIYRGKVLNFFNGFFPLLLHQFYIFSFEPISDAFIHLHRGLI
jgi:hypothetical protein